MPTNGMTIDSLNTVSSLTAQDEVPVWDKEASGEPTRKITAQNMTNSVKTLGSLVNTTEMNTAIEQSTADVIRTGDVVNSLTSTSTDKPLSANMGKTLNDKIGTLVKKHRTVTTTDSYGDALVLTDTRQKVILSVIPIRNAGDGTYSSWFGVFIGSSASGITLSVKCVNDNNEKLASTKVAIDVYYIEQTFS